MRESKRKNEANLPQPLSTRKKNFPDPPDELAVSMGYQKQRGNAVVSLEGAP
jgi:hypothetical protein